MTARVSFSGAVLQITLLVPILFQACGSNTALAQQKVEVVPQIGHSGAVLSVAFSPNGRTLLSGSEDTTLRLWDVATGELVRIFKGHSNEVSSVAFSPDGRFVLSASGHYEPLKLWDATSGSLVRSFGRGDSVAFSPDGRTVLSRNWDMTLRLWDVATGKLIRTLEGHSGEGALSVAFSPDGRTVLSGSDDGPPKLWDVATGKGVRTFGGPSFALAIAFSPDGRNVLSGERDKTLKLWDAATGKLLRTFTGHSSEVKSVAFSPDSRTVLSGSWDNTLKLWDAATGKLLRNFAGRSAVHSVAFSPDGRTVLSGSDENTLELWDAATGELRRNIEEHPDEVNLVRFSPNGRTVLTVSGIVSKTLRLWDAATGTLVRTFEEHPNVEAVAFSPDSRSVLLGIWASKGLKLWDVTNTDKPVRTFEGHSNVRSVAFSPDGRTVLSGSNIGSLTLSEVATGKLMRTLEGHSGVVSTVAFSPDGRTVLSGGWDNTLKLWDVGTGKLVNTYSGRPVSFSPDGRTVLLSDSGDKTLKLWDIMTGRFVRTFIGPMVGGVSDTFSPDGRTALSGRTDGTLRLWDVATGKVLRTFTEHFGMVLSVAFSPDGRSALSGSDDGTTRFWSLSSGSEMVRLVASREGDWLAMTPAGFFDVRGDSEKLLHLVRGLDVFSIEQTYGQLYRPDLVEAALKGDLEGKYKDAAYRLNLETILGSGPAPQIEHLKDKDDRAGDTIRISVRITGKGGGVGNRIDWKVNGIGQGNPTPTALTSVDGPIASVVVNETLKLVPGKVNFVDVTAYNHAGLVATPPFKISIDKFGTTSTERPRMFVLALGVNKYRMEGYKLSYADSDAESFAKALKVVGSTLFAEVKTTALTDEQVSETGISSAINNIAGQATPDDVFVLFLGGHGKSIAGRYYYYPQTLDFAAHQSVEQNAIGQDKWDAWLRQIHAGKSLLIIDTCEGDAFRGSRGTESARETAMMQLQHATGRNVISAARDAAYEGYQGHGVLTYALLEALDVKAAHGGDEAVRIISLADYVEQRVPQITSSIQGIEQKPTHKLSGDNFAIGIRQAVLEVGPAIPKEPTHVFIRAELVREKPSAASAGSRQLMPGVQVRARSNSPAPGSSSPVTAKRSATCQRTPWRAYNKARVCWCNGTNEPTSGSGH